MMWAGGVVLWLILLPLSAPAQLVDVNPPVAGLSCLVTTRQHQAFITFSTPIPYGDPPPQILWQFSGAGVTPVSSSDPAPQVKATQPGVLTATVTFTFGNGSQLSREGICYVIGGPILIGSIDRGQVREQQALLPGPSGVLPLQPWILEYFGYDLKQGVPPGLQPENKLTALAQWAGTQPAGTKFIWELWGQGAFVDFLQPVTDSSTSCEIYAVGASGRGQPWVRLRYTFTLENTSYGALDTSEAYYAPPGATQPDPNYRRITCHWPSIVEAAGHANVSSGGGPPWHRQDIWAMELYSQLDPFKEVWVQERFTTLPTTFDPPPTPPWPLPGPFLDNAATGYNSWESGNHDNELLPYGLSGNAPGYLYNAKFQDYLSFYGFPGSARLLPGPPAVLSAIHDYFAATHMVALGAPGVFVGTFVMKMFTNGTMHYR